MSTEKVQFGSILVDTFFNFTRTVDRPKADSEFNEDSLASQGWREGYGTIPLVPLSSPFLKPYKKEIEERIKVHMDRIQDYLDSLPPEKDNEEQKLAIASFCDKDGKVLRPKYLNVSCYGRLAVWYTSQKRRMTGFTGRQGQFKDETFPPAVPFSEVPVFYPEIKTEIDFMDLQREENQKENGFSPISEVDVLLTIERYFRLGQTRMIDAKRRFPGTRGQIGFQLVKLDQLWNPKCKSLFPGEESRPALDLVARCTKLKVANELYIRVQNLNDKGDVLTSFINRSTPEGLMKLNEKYVEKNQSLPKEKQIPLVERLTFQEVDEYFKNQRTKSNKKSGKKSRTMGKDEWESLKSSDNKLVSEIADAHLSGDNSKLAVIMASSDTLNPIIDRIQAGDSDLVSSALAVSGDVSFPLYVQLVKAGHGNAIKNALQALLNSFSVSDPTKLPNPASDPAKLPN